MDVLKEADKFGGHNYLVIYVHSWSLSSDIIHLWLFLVILFFRKAIQELSIGLSIENSIECLYLRGSCYHAVGEYRDAVNNQIFVGQRYGFID